MDCRKAQRLIDEVADGRLPEPLAQEVRRHVADCTDCRVWEQRTARLQRLIALKRYERPPAGYFETFLGELRQRQAALARPVPSRWRQLGQQWSIRPERAWSYSLATATALAAMAIVTWIGSDVPETHHSDRPPALVFEPPLPAPALVAVTPVSALPVAVPTPPPASYRSPVPEGVVLVPAQAIPEPASSPRYVLDQITISPASYEVANARF